MFWSSSALLNASGSMPYPHVENRSKEEGGGSRCVRWIVQQRKPVHNVRGSRAAKIGDGWLEMWTERCKIRNIWQARIALRQRCSTWLFYQSRKSPLVGRASREKVCRVLLGERFTLYIRYTIKSTLKYERISSMGSRKYYILGKVFFFIYRMS